MREESTSENAQNAKENAQKATATAKEKTMKTTKESTMKTAKQNETQTAAMPEVNEPIGCLIDGSAESADYINKETIALAEIYGFDSGMEDLNPEGDDYSQSLSEIADEAIDYLNQYNVTPHTFFTFEENSLFLIADIDGAREVIEEDGGFISGKDADYPPADYLGLWLHVSDHGNVTLYDKTGPEENREIWAVV